MGRIRFQYPDQAKWYAVRVYFRREKYTVKDLKKRGFEAWIPIKRKSRKYATKTRIVDLPLITQYIFVKITKKEYTKILANDNVITFLKTDNLIKPVTDDEINILKLVSGEKSEVKVSNDKLQRGDKVEVLGGELTGLKGELISFKGKKTVAIALESLGSHLLIEIPLKSLRKI